MVASAVLLNQVPSTTVQQTVPPDREILLPTSRTLLPIVLLSESIHFTLAITRMLNAWRNLLVTMLAPVITTFKKAR